MKCPKCESENCEIITESQKVGKNFSATKGCCCAMILGPIGLLCGLCGKGKQVETRAYWVCSECGNKFLV